LDNDLLARGLALLHLLIIRAGKLVSKGEIMDAVWRGVIVEEANLTVQVAALRRILDRHRRGESCIQTVSGRGYRFIAPMVFEAVEAAPTPLQHDPQRGPTATSDAEPERRQSTALYCELIAMSGRDDADLDDLRAAVAAFHRCVAQTVCQGNGFIASRLGNAALAVFG
jgi:DNA-binding winged helix-turn-helix (wHTH) protein